MKVRKLELEVQEKAKDKARLSEQWDQQRAQQQDDAHTQMAARDQQRVLLQQLHHHEESARQCKGMFDAVSRVQEQRAEAAPCKCCKRFRSTPQVTCLCFMHIHIHVCIRSRSGDAAPACPPTHSGRAIIQRLSFDFEAEQKWAGDAEARQVAGSGGGMASPALVSQLC